VALGVCLVTFFVARRLLRATKPVARPA
jgi:hypothetical protein